MCIRDRIYLAGAFGNYLDREKAVALGMFPGISVDKIIPIGNAAAEGAGLCLLSLGERKMADRIASFVKPVEPVSYTHLELLCMGTSEAVYAAAYANAEIAGLDGGYVMMPGCDLAARTPLANILAMVRASYAYAARVST